MRFLGIEIQRLEENGTYYLHQGCYVREVLDRHAGREGSGFIKVPEEKEESAPSLGKRRRSRGSFCGCLARLDQTLLGQ